MFALTMGPGSTLGTPDTCLTPAPLGPVPVPYVNVGMSSMAPDAVMTVLLGSTPALNQMANIAMTSGDEAGSGTGVVSHMIKGENSWNQGSAALFVGGSAAVRLTTAGGANCMGMTPNCTSTCVAPSQNTVSVMR